MSPDPIVVRCPHCGAKNRVPPKRWGDSAATCGRCKSRLSLSALFPDRPVFVTDSTFEREVLAFRGPVVLEFFSPGCPYCRRLAPVIDELASQYAGRVKFVILNMDQNHLTASRYGVNSTPTLYFYKGGRLIDRVAGALPQSDLVIHLDRLIATP